MKSLPSEIGADEFDPDRGEPPDSSYPGAPVWEPGEGLDAYFPDACADVDANDDKA